MLAHCALVHHLAMITAHNDRSPSRRDYERSSRFNRPPSHQRYSRRTSQDGRSQSYHRERTYCRGRSPSPGGFNCQNPSHHTRSRSPVLESYRSRSRESIIGKKQTKNYYLTREITDISRVK